MSPSVCTHAARDPAIVSSDDGDDCPLLTPQLHLTTLAAHHLLLVARDQRQQKQEDEHDESLHSLTSQLRLMVGKLSLPVSDPRMRRDSPAPPGCGEYH